jgi:predicted extracellular nuclease
VTSWRYRGSLGLAAVLVAGLFGRASLGQGQGAPGAVVTGSTGAFTSPESCAALVSNRQRLPRAAQVARFASWNLHWFPDGKPGSSGAGSDVAWLACTLAWLDADVIAVQEVKQTPAARAALEQLLRELNRLSAGRYVSRLDDCGSRVPQHVGLIWNEARVTASNVGAVAALNPSGEACGKQLRPGLAARLRFRGGLDLTAISAHFKSMADERALDLRESTFAAVPGVLREVSQRTGDADLLLLGDLNTMGCDDCSPPVSARDELLAADQGLRRGGLRVVTADAPGSHFHDGQPSLLDHALASLDMRELDPAARTHVAGVCATGAGPTPPNGRAAKKLRQRLSDHCPIVLDLSDRDLD